MRARVWAVVLAALFGAVLAWYLVYTQRVVDAVRTDAAALSRMYARIFQNLSDPEESGVTALFDVLGEIERLGIPVVVIDASGQPSAAANLPFEADLSTPEGRRRVLEYAETLDRRNAPIVERGVGEIHFGVPAVVDRLRWVPWIQAATFVVIVLVATWILRSTLRAERERVWATMARESAHQLGTPLSSLSGWVEILRMEPDERASVVSEDRIAREIEVDVERLQKVAQRFELIGRRPRLKTVSIDETLEKLRRYFDVRLPRMDRSITLRVEVEDGLPPVAGNPVLLEWAFENIIKNAVDVLAGRGGTIEALADRSDGRVRVRIVDDGPGVPPELRKRIFQPGTSRKEGGWGVGLSLARRIIEDTHGGSIALGRPERGAEFIVELPIVEGREGD